MADFALPAFTVAAVAVLLRSGLGHLHHRAGLRSALDRQDLVPVRLRSPLAGGLGPLETTLGLALGATLVTDAASVLVGGLTMALGGAFLVFLALLGRAHPDAPCGCVATATEVAGGVGALDGLRAGLVLAGGLAAWVGAADRLADLTAVEAATTAVAGLAVAAVADVAAQARSSNPPAERLATAPS